MAKGAPGGGRTLSGCRVVPQGENLLVCREANAANETIAARGEVFWDGRFRLRFPARKLGEIRRLGSDGWRLAVSISPELRGSRIPSVVRPSLPSIWNGEILRSVPHLGIWRDRRVPLERHLHHVVFSPRRPLAPARFTLQKGEYTLSK
jgi:tRNA(Ile)-lysidine synthase